MSGQDWISKGDKLPRRSPRRRGKTCGRPFTAPRQVADLGGEREESQAVILTETEKERDMEDREEAQPLVIPFIPDMSGSEKEIAQESFESVKDTVQDNAEQTGQVSDTTGRRLGRSVLRLFAWCLLRGGNWCGDSEIIR